MKRYRIFRFVSASVGVGLTAGRDLLEPPYQLRGELLSLLSQSRSVLSESKPSFLPSMQLAAYKVVGVFVDEDDGGGGDGRSSPSSMFSAEVKNPPCIWKTSVLAFSRFSLRLVSGTSPEK